MHRIGKGKDPEERKVAISRKWRRKHWMHLEEEEEGGAGKDMCGVVASIVSKVGSV